MSADGCAPLAEARSLPASEFDHLPYPSLPFAYTQPSHMAAMASLFGLYTPLPEVARVLELGCASGGNIIPLAARFPSCRFVGVDLSERQVKDGRARIAALALSNIEILQADLADFDLAGQEFDYVVCHGVFSWVPRTVQDAILRICRDALGQNGIAAISYNVLPGWHLRSVVREICLNSIGDAHSPRQRVARARAALERVARSSGPREPYGQVLRNEARRLARLPDAYVLGEFLSADNAPCSFSEFAARALDHGLAYICEADLAASCSESLFADARAYLQETGETDRIATEQAKDFLTGRPFRRSLLTKACSSGILVQPDTDSLRTLHFAAQLARDPMQSDSGMPCYRDSRGRAVKTSDPAVGCALARLSEAYPATLSFEQLTASAEATEGRSEIESKICGALFALAAAGQATVSALPLQVERALCENPRVWPLARIEAGKQPWLTNLRHEAVAAPEIAPFLCPLLDGTNDRSALEMRIAEAIQQGKLKASGSSGAQAPGDLHLRAAAATALDRALADFARSALLEPENSCN
jgi:SAM-dependent methyltransferase